MRNSLIKRIKRAPRLPGVYLFCGPEREILYVGKAKDLRARLTSYLVPEESLAPKTSVMLSLADGVLLHPVGSELEALLLEAKLIKKFLPKYNSQSRDDKRPLYIKITSETFPKVLTARRHDPQKAFYYGPFPSSAAVRSVLAMLRRIFPYCSAPKIGKRACFNSQIGLCRPCPSEIIRFQGLQRRVLTRQYRKNVSHIKRVLGGDINRLLKDLGKEMSIASGHENFEEAKRIRDEIRQLEYIIQRPSSPEELLANPNLPEELASQRLKALFETFRAYFPSLKSIQRIEAYDVANIQGRVAVGSQVTFVDGIPEKDQYRRYRVRLSGRPNDVGMMKEVLRRRFSHPEWDWPQLILVDGGKPQVGAAMEVMREVKLDIPVIGLAKREEKIVIPYGGQFKVLRLSRGDSSLQLLQQIRDEAHRFAQAYHHHLMRKRLARIDIP